MESNFGPVWLIGCFILAGSFSFFFVSVHDFGFDQKLAR